MAARFVLGIGGGTGAGKTTVARDFAARLDSRVVTVPLDRYYEDNADRPLEERRAVNYDHPDAFEWPLLLEHVERLLEGEAIPMPRYDFTTYTRGEPERVEPAPVVVLEGIFALYKDALVALYDLPVYVQADADVRILRRIRRDVGERGRDLEGVIEQYLDTVKPMHERYVAPTRRNAELVIPGGSSPEVIDLLERVALGALRDPGADPGTDAGAGRDPDLGAGTEPDPG